MSERPKCPTCHREYTTTRTPPQNRLMWVLLKPFAEHLGYTAEELKLELMGLLWGTEERTNPFTGEVQLVPKRRRTSRLTKDEMRQFIDFMVQKAAETGYVMALPDDWRQSAA